MTIEIQRIRKYRDLSYAEKYRVAKERWDLMSVRLMRGDKKRLKAHSDRTGVSQAELIRTYIEWGLENDT